MAELKVTVPIKFSEKAQKDLYETCMGYKELAEMRGAESAELRDDLQRANDAVQDAEHDESMAWDRVRKAERENAKLRELVERLFGRLLELLDENDELRKLVSVMAYCMQRERECDGCRLNDADGAITAPVGCDGLLDRMRELGIEED